MMTPRENVMVATAKAEGVLCPLAGFAECRRERCALWDDDWALCSLSSGSRYSGVRAAVSDAAVEVMGEYRGKGDRGTSSVTGCAGATFPTGGRLLEDGEAGA